MTNSVESGDSEKCPECGELHEHRDNNDCACCGKRSVEIGVHRPVLCWECSKALSIVRKEINPCPNCGKGAGQSQDDEGYRCRNRNCRVKYFKSETQDKVYTRILEKRRESGDLESPGQAPVKVGDGTE